jgi:aryl-alcohol dehydrogenase-like predicted oxidoreductase
MNAMEPRSRATVTIDRTSLEVSRIVLGTGSLHHLFSGSARTALLSAAVDAGVTHFDTAPYYGDGLGEASIGALAPGLRARIGVTTKIGLYPRQGPVGNSLVLWARRILGKALRRDGSPRADLSLARSRASLESSLRTLRRERIEFLLLHEPVLAEIPHEALAAWLADEVRAGRVGAVGVAGERARVEPFVAQGSPLAQVVQTRDTCSRREADFLAAHGRTLQFTYGYFSGGGSSFAEALERNAHGAIIFSTRRMERLQEVARCLR